MNKPSRSKIKRAPKRGHYDEKTIFQVLDAGQICHVAFIHEGRPVVIPTTVRKYAFYPWSFS